MSNDRGVRRRMSMMLSLFTAAVASSQDEALELHEDYSLGFSQGVYYGLLLAGTEYDIAWCVKSELDYEGDSMGSGGEFQVAMEALLATCRSRFDAGVTE